MPGGFFSLAETLSVRLKKARDIQAKAKEIIHDDESKYKGTAGEWMHKLKNTISTASGHRGISTSDSLIQKARKLSAEWQQLLGLKRRYADEQNIAQRLSKKLRTTSTQVQSFMDFLKNELPDISVAQLADSESALYACIAPDLNTEGSQLCGRILLRTRTGRPHYSGHQTITAVADGAECLIMPGIRPSQSI